MLLWKEFGKEIGKWTGARVSKKTKTKQICEFTA